MKTTKEFINEAMIIHDGKYDYTCADYNGAYSKVKIVCHKKDEFGDEHGEFFVTPHNHLSNKSGCPKCQKNHNRYTTESFIKKLVFLYGNKYDYSKVEYVNNRTKICIICPIHGEFFKTPNKLLQRHGCPKCSLESRSKTFSKCTEDFIKESKKVHGNKYDYSKVEYTNAFTKVCIICPKHGEFWQTPHHHLNNHGCPVCNTSRLENIMMRALENNKIDFKYQYNSPILEKQRLDFYIENLKIGIECQGEQHFKKVYYRSKYWDEEKSSKNLEKIKKLDEKKKINCAKNGIILIYFSDLDFDFPYKVYKTTDEIIKFIKDKLNEMG